MLLYWLPQAPRLWATPELGLRILRDDAGNWQVWADAAGGTEYVLEASGTDATYITSVATGVVCTYTSSNADNFFYDDWFFGDEEVDESAPKSSQPQR